MDLEEMSQLLQQCFSSYCTVTIISVERFSSVGQASSMGDDARGSVTEATNHYSLAVWRGLTCFGNKLLSPLPLPNAAKFPINE